MTRIKICGITNMGDALKAAEFGAHAIGFVFCRGPRQVDPETARNISLALPPFVSKVGIFKDEKPDLIERHITSCRLDAIQIHSIDNYYDIHQFSVIAIRVFQVENSEVLNEIRQSKAGCFLMDTYDYKLGGGSGRTFDWSIAREATKLGRVILAGGLNHYNIVEALDAVHPYAVDVSSGVEKSPGIKDHEKMRLFIKEVLKWDNRID